MGNGGWSYWCNSTVGWGFPAPCYPDRISMPLPPPHTQCIVLWHSSYQDFHRSRGSLVHIFSSISIFGCHKCCFCSTPQCHKCGMSVCLGKRARVWDGGSIHLTQYHAWHYFLLPCFIFLSCLLRVTPTFKVLSLLPSGQFSCSLLSELLPLLRITLSMARAFPRNFTKKLSLREMLTLI